MIIKRRILYLKSRGRTSRRGSHSSSSTISASGLPPDGVDSVQGALRGLVSLNHLALDLRFAVPPHGLNSVLRVVDGLVILGGVDDLVVG